MRNNSLLIALLVMGIMLFAACGGGGSTNLAGDPADTTGDQTTNEEPAAQTFDEWTAQTDVGGTEVEEPATTVGYRALPDIPVDSGHDTSAADYTQTVLGAAAIDYSQCTVNGDAMIINDGGAADTNPAGIPAWALYRISGLTDLEPVSLNTECLVGASGMEYSVAVADYTAMEWKWFGPTTLPEYQADLADGNSFITNIGNLYFLVVCYGENTATHAQSTIVADDPTTTTLPGAPGELVASKGEIEGGVGLEWLPGTGAEYYEVFRQDQIWYLDDSDPVPGFDPEADWVLLDSTEDTTYFDASVVPGAMYLYKVRSVNAAGYSAFSNIDEGWAWDEIEPPFDGIHGYVWGEEWNYWDGDDPPPGEDFDPAGGGCCPRVLPLGGATVTLFTPIDYGPYYEYTATSDDDGFYAFDVEIEPGDYMLTCALEGWVFYEEYPVVVAEEVVPEQYDFFGYPEGSNPPYIPEDGIHGWVWGEYWPEGDPRGLLPPIIPIEGALIEVFAVETEAPVAECHTDGDGFFQFLELPAGVYLMTCELDDWFFEPEEHYFDIPEGEMRPMAFDFFGHREGWEPPPPPDWPEGLSGWVWNMATETGEILPMPGVDISVMSEDGDMAYTLTTGEDGFFHLAEIAAGFYIVTAYCEGYMFEPPEHPVVFDADSMDPVQVDFMGWPENWEPGPGPEPGIPGGLSGWAFCLGDPASSDGFYPVPDALVTVSPANDAGYAYTASTDEEGYFEVPISDFGGYTAVITKEGYSFDPATFEFELTPEAPEVVVDFLAFED